MNVFIIRNVASEYATLNDVFRGVTLFIVADLVLITIMVLFPQIALFLPNLLG